MTRDLHGERLRDRQTVERIYWQMSHAGRCTCAMPDHIELSSRSHHDAPIFLATSTTVTKTCTNCHARWTENIDHTRGDHFPDDEEAIFAAIIQAGPDVADEDAIELGGDDLRRFDA